MTQMRYNYNMDCAYANSFLSWPRAVMWPQGLLFQMAIRPSGRGELALEQMER